jgi:death on curing protein
MPIPTLMPRLLRCSTRSPVVMLIDGNKRLALAAIIAFHGLNGRRLTMTNDAAYDLVIDIAAGDLDSVDEIAVLLRGATRPTR